MKLVLSWLTIFASALVFSQDFTQNIRGNISDSETLQPIPGAKVICILKSDTLITLTNQEGIFEFQTIPVGRVSIVVQSSGFENFQQSEILLTSAKELELNIELQPIIKELEAIQITPKVIPREAINPMATVSSFSISTEQIDKFAGSLDDPMRAITNYPGINATSSRYNNFSVRGNPPIGTVYRLEGIPIHNPNHFAVIGSTGGFVTQFSSHLLDNSDFFASAFPAEYGNATSAVFDFKFREGSTTSYEHAFKASVLGFDFASEGPFKKGGNASYLINYRYSTLGVLARMINLGGVLPQYQDLSFNLNFPTKNAGTFKIFGIGGLSSFNLAAQTDSAEWGDNPRRVERNYGSNSGAVGITHYISTSKKGYLHTVVASSMGEYFDHSDYLEDDLSWSEREDALYNDNRLSFTMDYNHSGKRHYNKTGVIVTHVNHSYLNRKYNRILNGMDTLDYTNGSAQIYQAFSQSKFRLTEKFTVTGGLHFLYFGLNGASSIEPRIGLNFAPNDKTQFSAGYGMHSRVEDLSVYFYEEKDAAGNTLHPNQDLKLMQSHHAVLRFSRILFKNHKLNIEAYYQHGSGVPGTIGGSYTVQNLFYTFDVNRLGNVGEMQNYGLEFLFERYTDEGLYYIMSATIFDSKYKGGDDIWRNTEYNQQYAFNFLFGKEYELQPKENKKRLLGLNFNVRYTGGVWTTPIDSIASYNVGWTQYDMSQAFSEQLPALYNVDFTLNLKGIRKKVTGEFSFQIKNLLNRRIAISRYYDYRSDQIIEIKDYGMIPVFSYKINF